MTTANQIIDLLTDSSRSSAVFVSAEKCSTAVFAYNVHNIVGFTAFDRTDKPQVDLRVLISATDTRIFSGVEYNEESGKFTFMEAF